MYINSEKASLPEKEEPVQSIFKLVLIKVCGSVCETDIKRGPFQTVSSLSAKASYFSLGLTTFFKADFEREKENLIGESCSSLNMKRP